MPRPKLPIGDTVRWSGNPRDEHLLMAFLRRGDLPWSQVIWWLEPDFSSRCDLLITRVGATSGPLRVRPGDVVVLTGTEFSVGPGSRP